MMQKIMLFAVLLFLVLAACKDKDENQTPGDHKIYFTGISQTDENGSPLAYPDTTDWRLNDVWTAQESALFPATSVPVCTLQDTLEIFAASPNPIQNQTFISFFNIAGTVWQFRLVDEDFNPLWVYTIDNFLGGYNTFILQTTDYPKDTLRLYYQAERNGCRWQGHGDILVKP